MQNGIAMIFSKKETTRGSFLEKGPPRAPPQKLLIIVLGDYFIWVDLGTAHYFIRD
jgi:hypothetical protein